MGTLTADQTRLPDYCEHKLPTSCRLSSIPNCCACADERAHAASYSTYIDGVGFVLRGTRWQRYCWFCKEFWAERVRVSGLRSGQTKIPEVPDQTDFLKKWYEFHQGYRIVIREDGSEERVGVLGEDFKDVSPGCLPRTLEELRMGRRRIEEVQQVQTTAMQQEQESGPGIEETLEQMFAAASAETENNNSTQLNPSTTTLQQPAQLDSRPVLASSIHAQAMNPAGPRSREYQMRRVAALRRELNRMRNGIERVITGLRDLGEDVPNHDETTGRLTELSDTLDTISGAPAHDAAQRAINSVRELANSTIAPPGTDNTLARVSARVDEARTNMEEARRARDQAASELDLAEQEFRTSQHRFHQIQREQRSTENYMRIFGTREEVIAQGENYQSPIGSMFSRAYERFHAAEEVRREERTLRQVLRDEARAGGEDENRHLAELDGRSRDVWGVPQPVSSTNPYWSPEVTNRAGLESLGTASIQVANAALDLSRSRNTGTESLSPSDNTIEARAGPIDFSVPSTPPTLVPTSDESALEEYYAMLRMGDHQSPAVNTNPLDSNQLPVGQSDTNFPRNMLNAIVAAREREVAERTSRQVSPNGSGNELQDQLAGLSLTLNNAPQAFTFSPDEWWHLDANHIIRALTSDDELREQVGMAPHETSVLLAYFIDDVISEENQMVIDGLLRNSTIIWRTGLPAEWIRRRQSENSFNALDWSFFTGSEDFAGAQDLARHYNPYLRVEIVAQAYQMSASVRQLAGSLLTPPQRLQMLYRLQAGRREDADVAVLQAIHDTHDGYQHALRVYYGRLARDEGGNAEASEVDETRQNMARDGDHSRNELDTRRRDTTRAMALAVGLHAIRRSPNALMQQLVEEQAERERVARQRYPSHYLNHPDSGSDSDSDEEDEEATPRGLDATDTGRPEPKPDEELIVQMQCKICYTQLSEVACLPCGHLVMCRWCSEQHSPVMQHDRTRPRRAAACPVCRKGIRQKVRVFRA